MIEETRYLTFCLRVETLFIYDEFDQENLKNDTMVGSLDFGFLLEVFRLKNRSC